MEGRHIPAARVMRELRAQYERHSGLNTVCERRGKAWNFDGLPGKAWNRGETPGKAWNCAARRGKAWNRAERHGKAWNRA